MSLFLVNCTKKLLVQIIVRVIGALRTENPQKVTAKSLKLFVFDQEYNIYKYEKAVDTYGLMDRPIGF